MSEKFTTKERKKEFDKLFKEKVLPFFVSHGFAQVTKTSKRMFKDLGNGLSVYFYLEFNNFGSGFYQINIAYYDIELGDPENDIYLALPKVKSPHLKARDYLELNTGIIIWLEAIQDKLIKFVENHSTHRAILESDEFYYAYGREEAHKELMRRKSNL